MSSIYKDFNFFLSADLDLDVKVYVEALRFPGGLPPGWGAAEDLIVSLRVIDGGLPLTALSRATRLPAARKGASTWREWLALPVKIRDLPKTAQLVIDVCTVGMRPVGGATVRLFDSKLRLKRGLQKVVVWPSPEALAAAAPGGGGGAVLDVDLLRSDKELHLLKAIEAYHTGDIPQAAAVDRLLFQQLRRELADARAPAAPGAAAASDAALLAAGDVRVSPPTLYLHFPAFEFPVLFEDAVYLSTPGGGATPGLVTAPPMVVLPPPGAGAAGGGSSASNGSAAGGSGAAGSAAGGGAAGAAPAGATSSGSAASSSSSSAALSGAGVAASASAGAAFSTASGADRWASAGTLCVVYDPEATDDAFTVSYAGGAGGAGAGAGSVAAGGGSSGAGSGAAGAGADGAAPPAGGGSDVAVLTTSASHPVEFKHQRLVRGLMRESAPASLKPDRLELRRIEAVLAAPPLETRIPREAADLLWKFRYALLGNRKALVKFLLCVDWENERDAAEAVSLLPRWAALDVDDAIRLLAPDLTVPAVREHAVHTLARASDEVLALYLLQLVQALRYEPGLVARVNGVGLGSAASVTGGAGTSATATGTDAASTGGKGNKGGSAGARGGAVSLAPKAGAPLSVTTAEESVMESPLATLLIERAAASVELGTFFYWYLAVEMEDVKAGALFARVNAAFLVALSRSETGRVVAGVIEAQRELLGQVSKAITTATATKRDNIPTKIAKLNTLVAPGGGFAHLCALPAPVPIPVSPQVLVAGAVPRGCHIFKSALYPTVFTFGVHPLSHIDWTSPGGGMGAGLVVSKPALAAATAAAAAWGGPTPVSLSANGAEVASAAAARRSDAAAAPASLDAAIASAVAASCGMSIPAGVLSGVGEAGAGGSEAATPVALLEGAAAGSNSGAASLPATTTAAVTPPPAASPSGLPWSGEPPASYKLIFKSGDDMRQDQLIIQMIRLMDAQLKHEGLDLRLSPYRVLATSPSTGMMEMVTDSMPVSAVMSNYRNDIIAFFRAFHPLPGADYGVDPDIMETYVKSCAGYCVVTYLLGIGDRHLDNIMLRKDGHLFHIDFGYIFGRDPKPFPAPIRLTREMIAGMGGPESSNYQRFKSYCCQAYNILRKSSGLFLSLLSLMRDAGIEALAEAPDVTLAKLQEKYRLDIDDEAADQVFLKLVDESVAAFFPAFFEVVHKIRVGLR